MTVLNKKGSDHEREILEKGKRNRFRMYKNQWSEIRPNLYKENYYVNQPCVYVRYA